MRNLLVFRVCLGGCGQVIRDAAVYQTEVTFMEQASTRAAAHLEKFVALACTCTDGKFVTEDCRQAADDALVIKHRVPWHKAMMLYNADLGKAPSKEPPMVPLAETLCPAPIVNP